MRFQMATQCRHGGQHIFTVMHRGGTTLYSYIRKGHIVHDRSVRGAAQWQFDKLLIKDQIRQRAAALLNAMERKVKMGSLGVTYLRGKKHLY